MNNINSKDEKHIQISALIAHWMDTWTEEDKYNFMYDRLYNELSRLSDTWISRLVGEATNELLRRNEVDDGN